QVRGVGRIAELRAEYRGRYRLRWSGDAGAFLKSLTSCGVLIEQNGRVDEAIAEVPENWPARRFFEMSTRDGCLLREVYPQEENLEAVYHRLIQSQPVERPAVSGLVSESC